jgi:hypothetical protein
MEEFGVRFNLGTAQRFTELKNLFDEIKRDKDAESFRNESEWYSYVPDDVRPSFIWPSVEDREAWVVYSKDRPIAIPDTSEQLSTKWDFFSVIDAFQNGDYRLTGCEKINDFYEMHIDPFGYPYGGLGPLIAIVEAFGFCVVGVNEYGKYLTRKELTRSA